MIPYVKDIMSLFANHNDNKSKVDFAPAVEHLLKLAQMMRPLIKKNCSVTQLWYQVLLRYKVRKA